MIQHRWKDTERAVIRQYFVNFITLRIRHLFYTVRCLKILSTHYLIVLLPILALKYVVLNGCLIHALGYWEKRLILSHFIKFLILGALPKSFISDFSLKSGKTPYKKYERYSRFKRGQLMLTLAQKWCDEVNISFPYFDLY